MLLHKDDFKDYNDIIDQARTNLEHISQTGVNRKIEKTKKGLQKIIDHLQRSLEFLRHEDNIIKRMSERANELRRLGVEMTNELNEVEQLESLLKDTMWRAYNAASQIVENIKQTKGSHEEVDPWTQIEMNLAILQENLDTIERRSRTTAQTITEMEHEFRDVRKLLREGEAVLEPFGKNIRSWLPSPARL